MNAVFRSRRLRPADGFVVGVEALVPLSPSMCKTVRRLLRCCIDNKAAEGGAPKARTVLLERDVEAAG